MTEAAQELDPLVSPGLAATKLLPNSWSGDGAWHLLVGFAGWDCSLRAWAMFFTFLCQRYLLGQQVAMVVLCLDPGS